MEEPLPFVAEANDAPQARNRPRLCRADGQRYPLRPAQGHRCVASVPQAHDARDDGCGYPDRQQQNEAGARGDGETGI